MKKSAADMMRDYALKVAFKICLEITLTILWKCGEWPVEGLEEFIENYQDWFKKYNEGDESTLEIIKEMREETGLKII